MARKKTSSKAEDIVEDDGRPGLSGDVKRSIAAIVLLVGAFVSFLGFLGAAAVAGHALDRLFGMLFGIGKWLVPPLLVLVGVALLKRRESALFYVTNTVGFILAFVSVLGLFHMFYDGAAAMRAAADVGEGGGLLGYGVAALLQTYTGVLAGTVILLALLTTSVLVSFNLSIIPLARAAWRRATGLVPRRVAADGADGEEDAEEGGETADAAAGDDDTPWETDGEEDAVGDDEPVVAAEDLGANIKSISFAGERRRAVAEDDDSEDNESEDDGDGIMEIDELREPLPLAPPKVRRKRGSWRVPPITLVEAGSGAAHGGDTAANQEIIRQTFANFGIAMEPAGIIVGPTVTQYAFRPQPGVKLTRITALSNDLALALAAHPIRIEAPIPGKALIGIEVPNQSVAPVRMQDAIRSDGFPYRTTGLQVALGKDVSGNFVIADLARMPHVLVAGSTGSGKSVTINAMILSLLYQNTPEDLRLILVDPKRVELSLYNGIPHLLSSVIVENGKVLNALKWAVGEMERRYAVLQAAGTRDVAAYNLRVADGELDPAEFPKMPAIVIVIDEMADLMASHGKDVEAVIVRLAQMSRAVGIHLVLSTQRPSVEVITGLIKANVPTRIALRVATQIDSRTILDAPGAEKLVGRGDMLYLSSEKPQPTRIQSIYVTEHEVKRVVDFLRAQEWPDDAEDGLSDMVESAQTGGSARAMDFAADDAGGDEADDPLYNDAKNLVIQSGKASTSYLQRRFRIGYSRAARLMDLLEDNGVIAPADGAKPRAVLMGAVAGVAVATGDIPMVGDADEDDDEDDR